MIDYLIVKHTKDNQITLDILKFIYEHIEHINEMGHKIVIHKVTQDAFDSEKWRVAMKDRGIDKLPALVVETGTEIEVHTTTDKIKSYYIHLLQSPLNVDAPKSKEDEYASILFSTEQETTINEDEEDAGKIEDSYRRAMQSRAKTMSKYKNGKLIQAQEPKPSKGSSSSSDVPLTMQKISESNPGEDNMTTKDDELNQQLMDKIGGF